MVEMPQNSVRRLSALALLMLVVSGCARGRMIHATAMPAEYMAPHIGNAQTVDLSKRASSSVSSDLVDRGDVLELTIESGYEKEHINNKVPIRVSEDGT